MLQPVRSPQFTLATSGTNLYSRGLLCLVCRCHFAFLCGVTFSIFVLFCVFFVFVFVSPSIRDPPSKHSSICMRPGSYTQLAYNNCACLCYFSFFGDKCRFFRILCTDNVVSFLQGERILCFPSGVTGGFTSCDHGLGFDMSLCE